MSAPDAADTFFGCAYCHEVYAEKSTLEVHQKAMHAGKAFKCVPAPIPEREKRLLKTAPTGAISKSIPKSEVSRHCIPEDCWIAINGKVYDVSEFMDRHPGGPTVILNSAGKDASKMYNDIHKGVMIDRYLRPEAHIGDYGVDEQLMSEEFWHTLRKARIVEVQEELNRILAESEEPSSGVNFKRKASGILDLLQDKTLDSDLRAKIQSLETQKRVALDGEDFGKAQAIKAKVDMLLAECKIELKTNISTASRGTDGSIPLSEVARHNKPHDCWIAINGVVYDLTDFLLQHPEQRNAVLAWAGRDASAMWDKIPGRFPSSTWTNMYMRPESRMGEVGAEPVVDPRRELMRKLKKELRRLEGPSEEDIQAMKVSRGAKGADVPKGGEDARYPKLADVWASKGELPFYSRAEVAKHKGPAGGAAGTEPWMIIHNKVYDLTKLMGAHPGGDELLMKSAGLDATKEFELFEHSEKARLRRDQDLLVGEIVPAERSEYGAEEAGGAAVEGGSVESTTSQMARYLRYKAADAALGVVGVYAYWTWQKRKPLPSLMYSRLLRHMHLIMAAGIFGAVGSAQAAAWSEGLAKKRFLQFHKQSGVAMLLALFVRIYARFESGIPPRFPGHPVVQAVETASLRLFYVLLFILPVSGIAQEYFLKWAGGDDSANDRLAQQAIDVHKKVGRFFEFAWLPFHLGYTTAYHYSKGRGVVRKVSPFI